MKNIFQKIQKLLSKPRGAIIFLSLLFGFVVLLFIALSQLLGTPPNPNTTDGHAGQLSPHEDPKNWLNSLQSFFKKEDGPAPEPTKPLPPASSYLTVSTLPLLPKSLQRFHELSSKTLRSTSEEEEIKGLLTSQQVFREAEETLEKTQLAVQPEVDKIHMAMTDYLGKALSVSRAGAERDQILDVVSRVILNEIPEGSPIEKILEEDKAELLFYAAKVDPRYLDHFKLRAANSPRLSALIKNTTVQIQEMTDAAHKMSQQDSQ